MEWGEDNHIEFKNEKDGVIAFTRRGKMQLKRRIGETKITLRGHTIGFNTEATRWLGFYLDTELQFRAHNTLTMKKATKKGVRVQRLAATTGLAPGMVRQIQVTGVQEVALYGYEIWCNGQRGWCEEYKKIIIRQSRAITEIFR